MTAARAKRLAMRWARYVGRQQPHCGAAKRGGIYLGHARAHSRFMYAGRPSPHGIRIPWLGLAVGVPVPHPSAHIVTADPGKYL